MAVYHFRASGTKTGAAGASTADDWTLANCYAPNENRWNDVIAQVSDGDSIILYDDGTGDVVTTHDFGTPNNSGAANAGTITIKSRSGEPTWCTMTCDGTGPILDCTEATIEQGYNFEGLRFSVTGHTTAFSCFRFLSATDDVAFTDCIIGPITYAGTGTGFGGGILMNFNVPHNLTLTDCTIEDVTGEFNDSMLIRHNGSSGSVTIAGTAGLVIQNCTLTDASGQYDGSIYLPSGATLASCTRLYIDTLSVTGVTASHRAFGGVHSESGAINFTLIQGKDVTVTSKQGGSALVSGDNVNVTGGTVRAHSCSVSTDGSENDPGGICFFFNGGTINIDLIDTHSCAAPFGTALYWGSGAGGTIGEIRAVSNTCRESAAAVYNGGYADQTIKRLHARKCSQSGTRAGSDAKALVMLTRLASGGSAAKNVTVGNVSIGGCSGPDNTWYPVVVNTSEATYALNFTALPDWELDNPAQDVEFFYAESHATAELNITFTRVRTGRGSADFLEDVSNPIANGSYTQGYVHSGFGYLPSGTSRRSHRARHRELMRPSLDPA